MTPKSPSSEAEKRVTGSSLDNGNEPASDPSLSTSKARSLASFVESFFDGSKAQTNGHTDLTPPEDKQNGHVPQLGSLIHDAPDALIVVHKATGKIMETNRKFSEWSALSHESLISRHLLDIFHDSEQKAVRTLYEDAGAGGVHVIELPSVNPQERSRLIEFTSSTSQDGNYAIIVGRDIGERAATERYLRSERDRLNTFIRSMRDSLVLISPTGEILYANPACELTFESFELPIICHRWMAEFAKNDKGDLQGLTSAYEGKTLELESGDGRIFLVTRSFLFESGKKATAMLMAKDITDQKLIENQNHRLEIELVRESKLAEFGTVAAGIAHNLNGPLTGILGFCDLMQLKNPELKEFDNIRQQAFVMKGIVSNLLHKSRSEQETKPQDLILEDIIQTELNFLEANLFYKHKVSKVIELCPDSPAVYGIYIDFSQVIGNLLRNAIDSMYKSESRTLSVRTTFDEKCVTIHISDTGCGMTEEVKANLFKPFFTTKPKVQDALPGEPTGTGLGLSTSRGILARYGAEISVDTAPGQGSSFAVRFPVGRKSMLNHP